MIAGSTLLTCFVTQLVVSKGVKEPSILQPPGYIVIIALFLRQSKKISSTYTKYSLRSEREASSFYKFLSLCSTIDHDGYQELSKLSYKILLMSWCLFSVVITNAFSGSILAFLNIRLHEQPLDTYEALAHALRRGETTAGTYAGTLMADMIEVSTQVGGNFPFPQSSMTMMFFSGFQKPKGHEVAMLIKKLMQKDPTLSVKSPEEGLQKVIQQKYDRN